MKCRDVVCLSCEQIAELFGVSRNRIYQLEQRALQKIRKALEAETRPMGVTAEEWAAWQLESGGTHADA